MTEVLRLYGATLLMLVVIERENFVSVQQRVTASIDVFEKFHKPDVVLSGWIPELMEVTLSEVPETDALAPI